MIVAVEIANDNGEAIPPNEQVWTVCSYLKRAEGQTCKQCPQMIWMDEFAMLGCYLHAREVINVVETGNPWRKDTTIKIPVQDRS